MSLRSCGLRSRRRFFTCQTASVGWAKARPIPSRLDRCLRSAPCPRGRKIKTAWASALDAVHRPHHPSGASAHPTILSSRQRSAGPVDRSVTAKRAGCASFFVPSAKRGQSAGRRWCGKWPAPMGVPGHAMTPGRRAPNEAGRAPAGALPRHCSPSAALRRAGADAGTLTASSSRTGRTIPVWRCRGRPEARLQAPPAGTAPHSASGVSPETPSSERG
jgi:hypothetical protein